MSALTLFSPSKHGLSAEFKLTSFAGLHGTDVTVDEKFLKSLISSLQHSPTTGDDTNNSSNNRLLDCSITPLKQRSLDVIQTTAMYYPLVDDPYLWGRIVCSSVLSSLYAGGVTAPDNMLMLLAVSQKLSAEERDVAVKLMIEGFRDAASEAGTSVQGGQTVLNPWLMMGGVATAVVMDNEFLAQNRAEVGDVLVLTKPLGLQAAVCVHRWLEAAAKSDAWSVLNPVISEEDARRAYAGACQQMARLNKTAARLMHTMRVHACTSVGSRGLRDHLTRLAECQTAEVGFVVHNLPVLAPLGAVGRVVAANPSRFQPDKVPGAAVLAGLTEGSGAEVSGGLVLVLPREQATAYCKEIDRVDGHQAWIIGMVEAGSRKARVIEKPRILDIPPKI